MTKELSDKLTPVQSQEMLYAFAFSWKQLFGDIPKKESLILLMAHTSLECGVGYKFTHNYNFGNIKSSKNDGCDFQYYKCNELVPMSQAKNMVVSAEADGGVAKITGVQGDKAWIWFYPKNKYCCFKAFETLNEGAIFFLKFLKNRYKPQTGIWNAVVAGNPSLYSHLLRQNYYYTADEGIYTKSVVRLFEQFKALQYDVDKIDPELTDTQKEKINSLIAYTIDQEIREEI